MKLFSRLLHRGKNARPFCSVIVPAAGSSSRMGGENKLFMAVAGVPVIAHTLSALNRCPKVDEIVVVTRSEDIVAIAEICKDSALDKVAKIICGGNTRVESVYNGLQEISKRAEVVLVHDGARPLVSQRVIERAIEGAVKHHAVVPAVPVQDTVKIVKDGVVSVTPERAEVYAVQTPQAFETDILKAALQNAIDHNLEITDDGMACEAMGMPVYITEGAAENIKITTPVDIDFARAIFLRRGEKK